MNNNELSLSQHEQALSLHQRIMTSGSLAAQNLWDMANALKEMRDGKLYKELGYQNFEGYCEEMVGMKRSNAYNYISIAERIKPENVQTFGHFGASKLMLLARLSDEEQKEIAEKIDETTTYKQLQEEINRIKGEKLKLENERERLNAKLKAEAVRSEEIEKKLIEESDINEGLRQELERSDKSLIEARDDYIKLAAENRELRERPVEVAVVENSDNERRLKETIKALEAENYRQNEMMDRKNIEDRRKFEADKKAEIAAIREEYEEKLRAAQSGEDKEKQEFKVFLVMAHDALDRLISAANGKDAIYKAKIKELLTAAERRLED